MKTWSILWQPTHWSPWQSWDAFHWLNAAGKRALNRHDLAQSFLNMLKYIEAQLGGGQAGLWIGKLPGLWVNPCLQACSSVGLVNWAISRHVPGRWLDKWPGYYKDIELRRNGNQSGG